MSVNAEPAKINIAPRMYGHIVCLYSAFSSTLPNIYLIPIISSITIDTDSPIVLTSHTIILAIGIAAELSSPTLFVKIRI